MIETASEQLPGGKRILALGMAVGPALAMTSYLVHALAVGFVVLLVLLISGVAVTAARGPLGGRNRMPASLLLIAVLVTAVEAVGRAYLPVLTTELGIYLPVVAFSCVVLRAMQKEWNSAGEAALDAIVTGISFLLVLVLVASIREIVGSGSLTLFPDSDAGRRFVVPLLSDAPVGMVALAPGALLVVGYLLGLQNWMSQKAEARARRQLAESNQGGQR